MALLPSNATPYGALLLWQLKALGYPPKVILTDGWDAYVQAMARVFPNAQHRLGRFPALRAALRRLRQQGPSGNARRRWADKLKTLFRTPSKRTVQRRLDTLQSEAHGRPAPSRRAPTPGQTAPAAASRRLDLASHDLQCRRTLLGRL